MSSSRAGTAAHPRFHQFVEFLKVRKISDGEEAAVVAALPRDFQTTQAAQNLAALQRVAVDGPEALNYS